MGVSLQETAAEASDRAVGVALRSGLTISLIDHAETATVAAELLQQIWHKPDGVPVASELLLALAHTGNYAVLARREGEPVGVSAAFRTGDTVPHLHSHITGVLPGHQGRSVGYALKLHQRAWALQHGIAAISWTFDPMQRRNAYFNIAKLGAGLAHYLPDFYGVMGDELNGGMPTDRAFMEWDLAHPGPPPTPALQPTEEVRALIVVDAHGIPRSVAGTAAPVVAIPLPVDVAALRLTDPELAVRWLLAIREAFLDSLAGGYQVSGFDRTYSYILRRLEDHASDTR